MISAIDPLLRLTHLAYYMSWWVDHWPRPKWTFDQYLHARYPQIIPGTVEHARGIQNDTHILMSGIVDELWLCGPRISTGMQAEADIAILTNTPVIHKPDICSGL